jgi:sigma-E factor negative regulatory protein RseC
VAVERAIVLQVKNDKALIQTQRRSACQSCQLENSCGQGLISKMSSERSMQLWLNNPLNAQVGQTVTISIPDEGLLKASVLMFVIPLLLMLAGSAAAMQLFGGDLAAISGGAAGLLSGFYIARVKSAAMHDDARFMPLMESIALESAVGGACHPKVEV